MSVFRKSAPRRRAPLKSAPGNRAPRRSLPSRLAFRRMAPARLVPLRSARDKSAPVRSARAPPCFPAQKRSCASRISASLWPLCLMLFSFLSPMVRSSHRVETLYSTGKPFSFVNRAKRARAPLTSDHIRLRLPESLLLGREGHKQQPLVSLDLQGRAGSRRELRQDVSQLIQCLCRLSIQRANDVARFERHFRTTVGGPRCDDNAVRRTQIR